MRVIHSPFIILNTKTLGLWMTNKDLLANFPSEFHFIINFPRLLTPDFPVPLHNVVIETRAECFM